MGEIQIQKIQRTVQVKDGDNKRKNEKESDGSQNVTRPIIFFVTECFVVWNNDCTFASAFCINQKRNRY